ncbi:hypothetical protein [Bradyrhizobium yuanmingense]|uniref:hypothetical protein n=1 Tax=Bradyrhizobium yuanmingense TaxID=108015 RepID=UPI0023B99259|nr:hypothetical protein [Bradyrhizobium yuanmingense]MDF0492730.1 hypothetical protein [Bradyrhizobium yuanmingense]
MSELAEHVTLSRVGYSVFILLVVAILLKSLISTWQSGKITVGEFDYYADGIKKAEFGEQIRAETFEFYNLIVRLIQKEAERTAFENNNPKEKEDENRSERLPAIRNDELAALSSKSGELQQLEITVQGVNIKNLFSALGGLVTPTPREVKASIFSGNNSRRVFVTAPPLRGKTDGPPTLISGGVESDTATAFRIACYMIWSQWDAANTERHDAVNFSEFCRVARLLYIRNTFDSLPSYEFQKQKFKDEIEFLKDAYQTAALARPTYNLIYSSLRGLERYVGDEKVTLTPTTTASIDSLVDLINFFSLQTERPRPRDQHGNWLKGLAPDITERRAIDRAYFQEQILPDCKQNPNDEDTIPGEVRIQFDNVVRILSEHDGQKIVRSGLIIADDTVITVGIYRHTQELELLSAASTDVQIVRCGKLLETHKTASVTPVSLAGGSPYLRLAVPGLKAKAPSPVLAADGDKPWKHTSLFVVGYLERSDGLFHDRRERRQTGIDNNDRLVFVAQDLPYWTSVGEDDDDAERFDLDIPMASGMIGSPIFTSEGKLAGLLGPGQYLGHMILGVGIAAKPIFAPAPAAH